MEESAGAVWLPIKAKAALSNAWLLRDFMPYETIPMFNFYCGHHEKQC